MRWIAPNVECLGYLPDFLHDDDPRPAAEQINERYKYGGWQSSRLMFDFNVLTLTLHYPGDPPLRGIAMGMLRDEIIILFQGDYVVILQKDGTWDCARID